MWSRVKVSKLPQHHYALIPFFKIFQKFLGGHFRISEEMFLWWTCTSSSIDVVTNNPQWVNVLWFKCMRWFNFRHALEVTEEFVQQLNTVTDFTEQEKLENLASKIIERVKVFLGIH